MKQSKNKAIKQVNLRNKNNIRVVFMGTPEFAVRTLETLIQEGFDVPAVITSPDKPAGRGKKLRESDVKKFARQHNLDILQPTHLKDPDFISQLKNYHADYFIVVAFRMLPEAVWALPRGGTINLHGSLLPHYRGAAPINRAIMNGEKITGVSTFMIEKEIDTGNLLLQEKINIQPEDNAGTIHDQLMEVGAKLVIKTLEELEAGNIQPIKQEELLKPGEKPKTAPKIHREDRQINWTQNAQELHNFIRGLSPYPGAWSNLIHSDGKQTECKILQASPDSNIKIKSTPGNILKEYPDKLLVATRKGALDIQKIQLSGKRSMSAEEFLRGHSIKHLVAFKSNEQ